MNRLIAGDLYATGDIISYKDGWNDVRVEVDKKIVQASIEIDMNTQQMLGRDEYEKKIKNQLIEGIISGLESSGFLRLTQTEDQYTRNHIYTASLYVADVNHPVTFVDKSEFMYGGLVWKEEEIIKALKTFYAERLI